MAAAAGITNQQMMAAQALTGKTASPMAAAGATSSTKSASSDSATISANDFLSLLVTEMKNQDPTADTDPNEYINQLVNVNSLEQLISINQTLTTSLGSGSSGSAAGAVTAATAGQSGTSASAQRNRHRQAPRQRFPERSAQQPHNSRRAILGFPRSIPRHKAWLRHLADGLACSRDESARKDFYLLAAEGARQQPMQSRGEALCPVLIFR